MALALLRQDIIAVLGCWAGACSSLLLLPELPKGFLEVGVKIIGFAFYDGIFPGVLGGACSLHFSRKGNFLVVGGVRAVPPRRRYVSTPKAVNDVMYPAGVDGFLLRGYIGVQQLVEALKLVRSLRLSFWRDNDLLAAFRSNFLVVLPRSFAPILQLLGWTLDKVLQEAAPLTEGPLPPAVPLGKGYEGFRHSIIIKYNKRHFILISEGCLLQ